MCKAKTPDYTPPPRYAKELQPDQAGLYEEARARAAQRGGGPSRSTVTTALSGLQTMASTARRSGSTVLG